MSKTSRTRLMIDFENSESLGNFLDEFKPMIEKYTPGPIGVWRAEALDFQKENGVTRNNTYIVAPEEIGSAERDLRDRLVITTEKSY